MHDMRDTRERRDTRDSFYLILFYAGLVVFFLCIGFFTGCQTLKNVGMNTSSLFGCATDAVECIVTEAIEIPAELGVDIVNEATDLMGLGDNGSEDESDE